MPRPKKAEKHRKGEYVKIPLTSDQKQRIMRAAEIAGGEMAPWARELLLRAADAVLRKAEKSR